MDELNKMTLQALKGLCRVECITIPHKTTKHAVISAILEFRKVLVRSYVRTLSTHRSLCEGKELGERGSLSV